MGRLSTPSVTAKMHTVRAGCEDGVASDLLAGSNQHSREHELREDDWISVVLEDDVTVLPCQELRMHLHRSRWLQVAIRLVFVLRTHARTHARTYA